MENAVLSDNIPCRRKSSSIINGDSVRRRVSQNSSLHALFFYVPTIKSDSKPYLYRPLSFFTAIFTSTILLLHFKVGSQLYPSSLKLSTSRCSVVRCVVILFHTSMCCIRSNRPCSFHSGSTYIQFPIKLFIHNKNSSKEFI